METDALRAPSFARADRVVNVTCARRFSLVKENQKPQKPGEKPTRQLFVKNVTLFDQRSAFLPKNHKLTCAAVWADKKLRSDVRQEGPQFLCATTHIGRGARSARGLICAASQPNCGPFCRLLDLQFFAGTDGCTGQFADVFGQIAELPPKRVPFFILFFAIFTQHRAPLGNTLGHLGGSK